MTPKQSWAFGPMLGFDLETTGVDVETDRAVTISLVYIEPGAEPQVHEWLVDPGVEIPEEATKIHGITTEQVREHGIPAVDAWTEAYAVISQHWSSTTPLVAYNLSFDVTMGDRELERHLGAAMPVQGRYCIDPIVIGRANDRWVKGAGAWKLGKACERYGVKLENAHNSTADTMATLRLAYQMAKMWPGSVGYVDLPTLHASQQRWHRQWAVGYANWLEKQAVAMERAWATGRLEFIREKLAVLNVAEEPSAEVVTQQCAATRERVTDVRISGENWPMRERVVVV